MNIQTPESDPLKEMEKRLFRWDFMDLHKRIHDLYFLSMSEFLLPSQQCFTALVSKNVLSVINYVFCNKCTNILQKISPVYSTGFLAKNFTLLIKAECEIRAILNYILRSNSYMALWNVMLVEGHDCEMRYRIRKN